MSGMRFGMLVGMTVQIAVRLPQQLLARVDQLVQTGSVNSRADAVRQALERLVTAIEHAETTSQIVAGYTDRPVGEPDDWGRLDLMLDWSSAAAMSELDRQEREAELEW